MGYGKVICDNNLTVNGEWDIHFYIPSGASSQFVKGDGSLDSSTYLTSITAPVSFYWTEASGTLYPTTTTDRILIGGATDDGTSALQVNGNTFSQAQEHSEMS